MRLPTRTLSFLWLLILLSAAPAWSQSGPRGVILAQADKDAVERWQRMTAEEKQEMRERFQRWQNLPPGEKDDLQKKFETWRQLSPEDKAVARKNFERWQ